MILSKGTKIRITQSCDPYYYVNDQATIIEQTKDWQWIADFNCNKSVYGNGRWFVNDDSFEIIFENENMKRTI